MTTTKQIANTFYSIAHESEHRINRRKKPTPDNLHKVWHYNANYELDRYSTLAEARMMAEDFETYKIYKTEVVEEA